MSTTLQTEKIFGELHSYLEESNLYDAIESQHIQINTEILSAWDPKVKKAAVEDFLKTFNGLKIGFEDSIFEISAVGEQGGPTIFLISLLLIDSHANETLKVFIKSIIYHKKTFIYLDSIYANQKKYEGSSRILKRIFKKLKVSDMDFGYFHPISLTDLFNDGG